MADIKLGDCVRDTVSGFTGIVIAKSEYMSGITKYCVESIELDNGKMAPEYWLDEWRILSTDRAPAMTEIRGLKPHKEDV